MNPALPKVYLVRHGDTPWTQTGQHTGRTDLELTANGERQARELAPRLAALRVDRVLSSPLRRAQFSRAKTPAEPGSRVRLPHQGATATYVDHRTYLRGNWA